MNPSDFGKYDITNLLLSLQDEMETHISALEKARKDIASVMDEMERLSVIISCMETQMDMYGIDCHDIFDIE